MMNYKVYLYIQDYQTNGYNSNVKKERIRRELGKHYVKSENEVISYCRYINNQVKFEWD